MLKLIFIIIILYIIGQHFFENNEKPAKTTIQNNKSNEKSEQFKEIKEVEQMKESEQIKEPEQIKETEFENPNPWSRVIVKPLNEYPYLFHIKIKIPTLNHLESWKQIIPNIYFIPKTGELVIPSKDEASALALTNLIASNFAGLITIDDIIQKNLIQISITKAKTYDLVKNKLREQIMENLYGNKSNIETNFQQDLANQNETNMMHETFSDKSEQSTVSAWEHDECDYSYL